MTLANDDNQTESGSESATVDASQAFIDADVFYAEPTEPTADTEEDEDEDSTDADTEQDDDSNTQQSDSDNDDDDTEETADTEESTETKTSTIKYSYDDESGEYEFKSAGKMVKVDIEKLIENYSKGDGFETKMGNLNKKDRARAEEHSNALKALEDKEKELEALAESVESLLEEGEIDWEELRDTDASAYLREKARVEERKKQIDDAKKAVQERRAEANKAMASEELQKLVADMGWKSDDELKAGFDEIADYCKDIGMDQKTLSGLYHHKVYRALHDAAKYKQLKANAKNTVKEVKKAPKSIKSTAKSKKVDTRLPHEIMYGS